jgi:hypothetical protein
MRWLLIAAVALAGAATSTPLAAAATAAPTTQLTKPGCRRAMLPAARKITITAVMRPVSGTTGLEMMFDLERARHRIGPFATVRGRGLDQWVHPDNTTLGQRPGDVWKVDQKVSNLPGTAYYRFRVRFRWLGSGGRSLGTATELGPLCYEPELRPDLLVRSLTVNPVAGQPTQERYVAWVGNRGMTGAGPVQVELSVASVAPQSATVAWLRPHSRQREVFTGPACTPGSRLTVAIDPTGTVLDYDRTNNTLTVTCPAPAQVTAEGRRYT